MIKAKEEVDEEWELFLDYFDGTWGFYATCIANHIQKLIDFAVGGHIIKSTKKALPVLMEGVTKEKMEQVPFFPLLSTNSYLS